MTEVVVARYPTGIRRRTTLELSGEHPSDLAPDGSDELVFHPFAIDWLDDHGSILFHFNARPHEDALVVNSFVEGAWGEQVVVAGYPFERESGSAFRLRFDVDRDAFRVFVDGRRVCEFRHRASPERIREVRSTTFLWRLERRPWRLRRRQRGRAVLPEVVPARAAASHVEWVRAEDNPPDPNRLDSFRLYAVLCTWMEEDIVGATVENCLGQGVERVYLVDNGSTDATVERAIAAGATVGSRFESERFDDVEKTRHMQAVVAEVSAAADDEHVWWLWVDADEFHHGPRGLTLRQFLETLDRRFRIVGARFFNHLPAGEPAYVEGRHPLDYQPLCYEIPFPMCNLGHPNHPLQRWDRHGPRIEPVPGSHVARCAEPLVEPTEATIFHHFPYRVERATRKRLEQLYRPNGRTTRAVRGDISQTHMQLRFRSLDAVYRRRWPEVAFFPPCALGYVPELRPFAEWVEGDDRVVARWY